MPKPARFRERLAAINDIMRSPRLDLGDEPREVLLGKRFYGLLAHHPAGKRFVESDQRLGMIQFCLPVKACSDWALQIGIASCRARVCQFLYILLVAVSLKNKNTNNT